LLALDGGGIRGGLTASDLVAMGKQLRRRHSKPQLLLAEHFDVVGSVSMAKDPALTMSLAVVLKGFPFHLKLGKDQLLLQAPSRSVICPTTC
jgi:hypothetical protein